MEELRMRLQEYGRFLELEDSIPYWEAQLPDLRAKIQELTINLKSKQTALSAMDNPNFFQRLLGRSEDKKEKLSRQVREVTAALSAAQWEQKDLEEKIHTAKLELEALTESRETYEQTRQNAVLTTMQESQLMMEELAAFLPAAMAATQRVTENLESARFWMQKDAVSRSVSQANRKLECLANAQASAVRLRRILEMMPEGVAAIGGYLRNPEGYITGVTSEYDQLDRLNLAICQVQETRNQLRMLQ